MRSREFVSTVVGAAKEHPLTDNAVRYHPVYYRRAEAAIRRARESVEQANRTAHELLERTISWARETSYGRRYGRDLEDWPILSKADIAADPTRFRRDRFAITASTGGSTGTPLPLWRSLECAAAEQAFLDSILANEGRPMLEKRVAVLRADHVKDPADTGPPFGVWRNRGRRLVLSSVHLTPATLPWFVDALRSFRPDVLWVYPSALRQLLCLMEKSGDELSVPVVLSSSEMLTEGLFELAADVLKARVIDQYGQGERVCFAWCDGNREYRFHPVYGRVELLPEAASVSGAPLTARIIATGYWNSALPLVRYDTGDRVVLSGSGDAPELERISSGARTFQEIIGRADDYLDGPNGERITGLNHVPRDLEAVLQIQLVQENEALVRALVLPDGELTARDRDAIARNARALLPPSIAFEIEAVEQLVTLRNGKTPFIVRRSAT